MKNVFVIIKKEFVRFFKDKRMVLSVLLPGILIYVLYSALGSVINDISGGLKDYTPSAYILSQEETEIETVLRASLTVPEETLSEEQAKARVSEGELDILIVIPQNFNALYGTETPPDIAIYYNSANEKSSYAYAFAGALLEQFTRPAFTVNAGGDHNLASDNEIGTSIMSKMLPMLLFALLASSCVAVAPESIAGEKERGTLATMLVTPIKRSHLAVAKIVSLSCFALLGGLSSFLGLILSMPKLMAGVNIGALSYGAGEYFMIFGLIVSLVLLIISVFAVMSALSKSVKEAAAFISPLLMVIILLGAVSMIFTAPNVGLFAVPVLGCALAMSSILSFTISPLGYILALLSNLVVAAALIVLLGFMFSSEKVMFKK